MPLEDASHRAPNRASDAYFSEDFLDYGPDSISSILSTSSNISSIEPYSGKFGLRGKEGLSAMGTTKYELEDYIYEMECRQADEAQRQNANDEETQDIYARLAQKEQDLILAAELGKALLERNELLVQQNEKLAEDYSHKLEVRKTFSKI